MQFEEKLFLLRKKAGLSQAELSEKVGVSRQAISKWETGRTVPETSKMIAIANLFDVTIDYLIRDEQEKVELSAQGGQTTKVGLRKRHILIYALPTLFLLSLAFGVINHSLVNVLTILLVLTGNISIACLVKYLYNQSK